MFETTFFEAKNLCKTYAIDKAAGIHNVNIVIEPHKITAIVGESGSGKSTLLNLLYGTLEPTGGEVLFKGVKVMGPIEKLIPGHDSMKMVTQHTTDLNLFATVQENVSSLLSNINLQGKAERTARALEQLRISHLKNSRVADLSGGERQRTAIAKALINNPEVLLLDEPFNQVDASFREGLQQTIRQIVKETGLTVVLVSHDPEEVLSMADEMVVIKQGEILETGSPQQLYENPRMVYTAQLLSNCALLNKQQALVCGIKTEAETTAIYPEHIEITSSWSHKDWTVTQVLFKGAFEDLIIEKEGVRLRVINLQHGKYPQGFQVNIKLKKHIEF